MTPPVFDNDLYANPSVSTQPTAGVDLCVLQWGGIASPAAGPGTTPAAACAAWSASVSGMATSHTRLLPTPEYSLSLTVAQASGTLTITGTATDRATGAVKSVTGSGVLQGDIVQCATFNGSTDYTVAGSLTITG